jgi:L-ascorbate metabolism protein UlaG (beta-lactamase superfamily)
MVVNYLGGGSFKLQSGETSLLVDPESNRFKADAVLRTIAPTPALKAGGELSAQNEIFFPGEYEIKGIEILGIPVPEESGEKFIKTVYLVSWEEIKLAFLGHASKAPSAEIIDKLGEPDVLFLPVGGEHFLSPEAAAKLAKQFEPSFIIPTLYKKPADFLKAMGQKADFQEKLVFKKKDLVEGGNRVVLLEVKNG